MTRQELDNIVNNMPNRTWEKFFTRDEWVKILECLYSEYKKYSSIDAGFGMYATGAMFQLLTNDGPEILRKKYLN